MSMAIRNVFRERTRGCAAGEKAPCTRTKRAGRSDRGSVLMEYVVLCSAVGALTVLFWHVELYDFRQGWHDGPIGLKMNDNEIGLGRGTVEFYQRLLGAIALPLP